jgi:two-component system, response regulator
MIDWAEVLLVEDDPRDVRLTLRELRSDSVEHHIEVARDGEEALDFLFCRGAYSDRSPSQPPKVVFLDLKLPKVDGLQVLREMKADPRTRAIPVVALTSSREERDMIESYRLGVNSYIQKPVDYEQFRKALKDLGRYWLSLNEPPPLKTFSTE